MKPLVILFLVALACSPRPDRQEPVDPEGPPDDDANHAPLIRGIAADWTADYQSNIVDIEVLVTVIDEDGDDLLVTAKALAEYTDGRWSFLETLICTPSDSTPDQFRGYLRIAFEEIVTYRRIRFESWASDGEDSSQVNPARNLSIRL